MVQITAIGRIGGQPARQVTLAAPRGIAVTLLDHGARLTGLLAPDRHGQMADVVLGLPEAGDYATDAGYLGATCGRFANRIAGARFWLDGTEVRLAANEGTTQLHGGPLGWDKAIWQIDRVTRTSASFTHLSPSGDMGHPGTVRARVTYRIRGLTLTIEMLARTDAPTVVNMANHAYFNLAGQGQGDILGHVLQIGADHYLPTDALNLPTGEVRRVEGTAFDFRQPRRIGQDLPGPGGFDSCFCLSGPAAAGGLRPCLVARDPASGRQLRLATTEPGVQLYTGAHFAGGAGKAGTRYARFAGFATETQRFPDSPNHPHFPSARLNPGQTYRHLMAFDFTPGDPGPA